MNSANRNGVSTNVVSSVLGQAIYLLTQVAVLSSLAHMRGLAAVGQFGLSLAIATPIFVVGGQGLRVLQAVDARYEAAFPDYLGGRLAGLSGAAALTLLIGATVPGLDFHILLSITLMKVAEGVCETAYGAYQRFERLDLQARSQIIRGVAGAAFFYVLLASGATIATALYSQVIVWWFVALVVDYPKASFMSDGRLSRPRVVQWLSITLLRRALPVSSEMLIVNLQKSGQRYIVGSALGFSDLGTFTAIDYLQQAGVMIANAISQALLGRLAHLRAAHDRRSVNRIVVAHGAAMLALAVAAVLLLLMFGQQLVGLLIGVRSKEAQELLLLVTIAVGLRILTTAPAAHLYVCGWFRRTLLIQIVGTLLAIGFAGILVPSTGLRGVGYAIIIAAAFRSTCILLLYVRSHSKHDRPNEVQTHRSETAELPTAPVADAKAAVG